jgi:hypothetical protein
LANPAAKSLTEKQLSALKHAARKAVKAHPSKETRTDPGISPARRPVVSDRTPEAREMHGVNEADVDALCERLCRQLLQQEVAALRSLE